jgi:hypothetical protein
MSVYVVEIAGRAVVALDAADDGEAKSLISDSEFRRDLRVFQSGGHALWDGVAELRLRPAHETETGIWQADQRTATLADDRTYSRAFLVRVVDPTSFDDDDYDNDPD